MGKDGEKSKGHPMRNAAPTNLMAEGYIDVEGTYILSPCANERRIYWWHRRDFPWHPMHKDWHTGVTLDFR